MSETRAVTLETAVDTTGARAGFNEITREAGTMAQAVARSSQQAEAAITGIGDGGTASSRKAEAAQRTLIASIERATTAAQSGGRATAAYYELLARQRGIDPAVLQPYLNQLREIEQAQAKSTQGLAEQQAAQRAAAESAKAQTAAQRELAQAQAGRDSFLSSLREQIALYGRSTEEVLRYRAAQADAAQAASPLILQLQNMRAAQEQAEAATRAQAAAQRELAQAEASRNTFLDGLREQIALFGKSTDEVMQYRAAQLGAANEATQLIAQLRQLRDAQEQTAAAARAAAKAQQDAAQAQGTRDSFLAGLREQIALFGKSTDEVARYQAAQIGASTAAEPLIQQLRTLHDAQEQVTAAARATAKAQQDVAQAQSRRDDFLAGLREQIALYGKSNEEVLRYQAAQLGLGTSADQLITRLHALRAAQEQVDAAAKATAQAQRDAAQAQSAKDSFLANLREQAALYGLTTEEVLKYRAAQLGVAAAADPIIAQLKAMKTAQEGVEAAARATAQAQRDAAQVQSGKDSFIKSLEQQANAIGKTRIELLELQAAQLGVTNHAQPFIERLRTAEREMHNGGMSAAALAAALRGVPAQMTDIIVSLQGGQAPLTVLLQQGGQLRDMFGSVGGAAKALGGAVLGLINPYTVTLAAVAALGYAFKVGHDEYLGYARSLALTSNFIGATTDQLGDMARSIGQVTGSQHEAAKALTEITNAGGVALVNLARFGTVAVEAQRVFGKGVADTAAELSELGKSPLSALDKISEKYHFITAATYAQVKAAQDHGESIKAASIAQQAYVDGIDKQRQKVLDSLTDWERGWLRIKKAANGAVDAVIDLAMGRQVTNTEKINAALAERELIEKRIQVAVSKGDKTKEAQFRQDLEQNAATINAIRAQSDAKKKTAEDEGKNARADELRNKWLGESNILLTRQQQLQRDLAAARTEGVANGLSEEEIQNRLLVIQRKYNDVATTGIDTRLTALRRQAEVESVIDQRKLAAIAAQRGAGAITEDEAISQAAKIELDALDRQTTALQKQRDLTRSKLNSSAQVADIEGQIAVNKEQRLNRETQLTQDLIALDRQRFQASIQAVNASFDRAMGDREGLRAQVRDQRDYNAQIGLTSKQLLALSAARLEEQAARKESDADVAEGLDLNGELADIYRAQAAALRARAAAEREGFLKDRDPYVNLRISLNRYVEDSENAGGMIGDALTNAFRGAEDAFATFVTTGKLSFSGLATSIIADFARIQARSAIGGFASSLLGSMGTDTTSGWGASLMKALGGARANGGPVNSGVSYLVGERGPEIFTPSSSGAITPNHMVGAGGAAGNININTSIQVTSGGASSTTSGDQGAAGKALADMIASKAKEVILRESRQGGVIWNMRTGRA
jgi:lambda family phage tail tape measure protein